jgi:triacylglycerol esterase/lipase EstA (alpha/beta hydrolase family)
MLAQLLRIALFVQMITGAVIGLLLIYAFQAPSWVAAAGAFAMPLFGMVMAGLWACWISRAQEPWGHWWRSLLGENWAGIRIFLLRQPWTRKPPPLLPALGTEKRIPVVLVHGFLCNHRIWDDLAHALRRRGHDVLAVNLEPLFDSIDNYAAIIESAVEALCKHSGQNQVALVGHSMGGLAIRSWKRKHGTQRAARTITLGTPHWGTKARAPFPAINARQMHWQSEWLKELAISESDTTRNLMRIALTPQDNIVFPQRAQTLEGVETVVFEGIGHLQMCTDATVIQWVAQELADCTPSP